MTALQETPPARGRRLVFGALLAGFILGCLWWIAYAPDTSARMIHGIPANATFVSVHDNLTERWTEIAANPAVRAALSVAGVSDEDIEETIGDPELATWIRRLASGPACLAYVPHAGLHGDEAWILVTWIGNYERRFRWLLSLGLIDDVQRLDGSGAGATWVYTGDDVPAGQLTFALSRGTLIACYSKDTQIPELVRSGILHHRASRWAKDERLLDETDPDRGVAMVRWSVNGTPVSRPYRFTIEAADVKTLRGSAGGRHDLPDVPRLDTSPQRWDSMGRLLGDLPLGVVLFPHAYLDVAVTHEDSKLWNHLLQGLPKTLALDGPRHDMFLSFFAGEYGSHLGRGVSFLISKGVRVPTLLMGARVSSSHSTLGGLQTTLDHLNAARHWGLIATRVPVGDRFMHVLEGTRKNFYADLAEAERVAYAVCDGWLLLCSNAETLRKLLARYDRRESVDEAGMGRWRQALAGQSGTALIWFDIVAATAPIKQMTALVSFASLFGVRVAIDRAVMARSVAVLEQLAPLGELKVALDVTGDEADVGFLLGREIP